MPKQNLSTDSELYSKLEERSRRINFLINAKQDLIKNSMLNASVERDFIDHGFSELFEEIQKSSQEVIVALLNKNILAEEKSLRNLFEKIYGKNNNEKD